MDNILFDFESIVDLDLGIIHHLQHLIATGKTYPYINKDFLLNDFEYFKVCRVYDEASVIYRVLTDDVHDNWQEIRESILNEHQEMIIERAPFTLLYRLVQHYLMNTDIFSITIVCRNENQKQFIDANFPKTQTIVSKLSAINISKYDRVVVSNSKYIMEFQQPKLRNFLILNYRTNFERGPAGDWIIPPEILIMHGDVNTFNIVDAYTDVKEPIG